MNKKFLQPLLLMGLVVALLLSLGACSKKKKPAETEPTTEPTQITEMTEATAEPTTEPTVAPTEATIAPTEATGPVCEHPNATMVVDKEATCKEAGSQHSECPDCKFKGPAETIAKIGHIYSDWIVEKEATCIAEGNQYVECTMCKVRQANAKIPKTDHTPSEWILDKMPTSAEAGSQRQECDVCKLVLDRQEIPATGSHGLIYEKNSGGTYTVMGMGTCKDTVVYIPGTYDNIAVTAIGDRAFAGCGTVERIVLPDSVTKIGVDAFKKTGLAVIPTV